MNKQQKRDRNNIQILIEQVKMNSTNHPTLNVRVFIAPLGKHCCANAVASDGFKSHWIPYFFPMKMIIIIINSQGSLTRMHKRILNSDTLQRQWTKLLSYRAVSSGRSWRADLRWRKVSEWHICISKPIKKTLGIPSGYPQAKRGYFALQFSSSVRKEMYKEQCGESVYLKG